MSVKLCKSLFGKLENPKTKNIESVEKFTWKTSNRLEISVITFGASFVEIKAPNRDGIADDILLGYEKFEDYVKDEKFHFGSLIGPISGIVKNGEFCVNGKFYNLKKNYKKFHSIDGGSAGLHRVNWLPFVDGNDLILSHATEGHGFPGILLIQCCITVKSNNKLMIKITARTNKISPIDLSYKFYFNLSGASDLKDLLMKIQSSEFSEKNKEGIFKKTFKNVDEGKMRKIGENFDFLYKLDGKFQAIHVKSGRTLEISSNQKFLEFSSCANFPPKKENEKVEKNSNENLTLDFLRSKLTQKEIEFFKCRVDCDQVELNSKNKFETENFHENCEEEEKLIGKKELEYFQNCGFSISCHNFPNAVNHQSKFPEILLEPGKVYENFMEIKFGVHVPRRPIKPHPIEIKSCSCLKN